MSNGSGFSVEKCVAQHWQAITASYGDRVTVLAEPDDGGNVPIRFEDNGRYGILGTDNLTNFPSEPEPGTEGVGRVAVVIGPDALALLASGKIPSVNVYPEGTYGFDGTLSEGTTRHVLDLRTPGGEGEQPVRNPDELPDADRGGDRYGEGQLREIGHRADGTPLYTLDPTPTACGDTYQGATARWWGKECKKACEERDRLAGEVERWKGEVKIRRRECETKARDQDAKQREINRLRQRAEQAEQRAEALREGYASLLHAIRGYLGMHGETRFTMGQAIENAEKDLADTPPTPTGLSEERLWREHGLVIGPKVEGIGWAVFRHNGHGLSIISRDHPTRDAAVAAAQDKARERGEADTDREDRERQETD